jgi:hypothetical protein
MDSALSFSQPIEKGVLPHYWLHQFWNGSSFRVRQQARELVQESPSFVTRLTASCEVWAYV